MKTNEKKKHTKVARMKKSIVVLPLLMMAFANNSAADIVHLDDVIIDGSACIGLDCVNGESFGFDTIRLKENNLHIRFQDTSSTSSFPTNDWQITVNDSANGGANKFSIDDIDGGRTPFTIEAGAPSHSLYVDDGGRIGLGTSTPVVDIHSVSGNTPTLRLDQNGSSGFTPQTWDVAGNEANFFVRDVTNGSKLPFKIFPNAPTNSLTIEGTTGDLGIGTSTPGAALHVERATNAQILVRNSSTTAAERVLFKLVNKGKTRFEIAQIGGASWTFDNDGSFFNVSQVGTGLNEFRVSASGNGHFRGNSYALVHIDNSSREVKTDFKDLDERDVLAKLVSLPVTEWRYKQDGSRHFGPVAEEFQATFGLGDGKHIATVDTAGVTMAAVQGLYKIVQDKDEEIQALRNEKDAEVSQLKEENKSLAERLEVLEKMILYKEVTLAQ